MPVVWALKTWRCQGVTYKPGEAFRIDLRSDLDRGLSEKAVTINSSEGHAAKVAQSASVRLAAPRKVMTIGAAGAAGSGSRILLPENVQRKVRDLSTAIGMPYEGARAQYLEALSALGPDAKPEDVILEIRRKFGLLAVEEKLAEMAERIGEPLESLEAFLASEHKRTGVEESRLVCWLETIEGIEGGRDLVDSSQAFDFIIEMMETDRVTDRDALAAFSIQVAEQVRLHEESQGKIVVGSMVIVTDTESDVLGRAGKVTGKPEVKRGGRGRKRAGIETKWTVAFKRDPLGSRAREIDESQLRLAVVPRQPKPEDAPEQSAEEK